LTECSVGDELVESQRAEKSDLYGEAFFDSGNCAPGTFSVYSFNNYCRTFKPLCEIIKKHFSPHRVLDIGCAKGSIVSSFRALGIEAYGVDVSSYAISCAPKILQPFLHVADLDSDPLPFPDNFFDFVTFLGSIEYLHNHKLVIAELERVMADGGTLLLTSINKRPEGDLYRINVHKKSFWVREFGARWRVPNNFNEFMGEYLQRTDRSVSAIARVKKKILGKYRLFGRPLVFLREILVSLGILDDLIILLTLKKNSN